MRGHAIRPTTRPGVWAAWLAAGYLLLMPAWRILPGGAIAAFVSGLGGGIVGLVAILRRGERALAVYAAVLPLVLVVVFVAAELLVGHD
jgi:hypothetical protein